MPAPANWTADNVTECAIIGQWTNLRPVVQVFYLRREEDDPAESARDLLNNWQDHIVPQQMNNYTCLGVRYRDRNSEAGTTGFLPVDGSKPFVGGSASAASSPNVSLLITKAITGQVGRRGGLIYHGPPAEEAVDENGVFAAASRAAMQTSYDNFYAGVSGAFDNELVVVHLGGDSDQARDVSTVTGLQVQGVVATQRRRLRKS